MSNILDTIYKRQSGSKERVEDVFIRDKWRNDKSLYKKDLLAHFGCVNAVEFSDDGDLMVSGGDDKRVLCWDVDRSITSHHQHQGQSSYMPVVMSAEHDSNIFCLSFDDNKTKIYSGGNDAVVIVHDVETTKPLDVFRHEEPVYGLSVHPTNSNIFLTACSDGRVLLFDLRQRPGEDPVMLAGYSHAFHAVQFNPVEPRLVVTANQKHGIGLWDVRKPEKLVLEYGRPQQTSMYVRWNMRGDRILGLRRRLSPVLYRVDSPAAVAQFDHPGYYNSCTMKSCCFGGQNDEFVLSGSDDFNVYMWRVPEEGDTCATWQARAHHVLQGHRSIVNQVRYNHSRSVMATSGVEKVVKLWSVLHLPSQTEIDSDVSSAGDDRGERRVFSHEEYIGLVMRSSVNMIGQDYSTGSTKENPRMMAFFDSLVQREIEGWDTDDSDNSQEEQYLDTVASSDEDGDDDEETGTIGYTRRERTEIGTNNTSNEDLVEDEEESGFQSNNSSNTTESNVTTSSLDPEDDSLLEPELSPPRHHEAEAQNHRQSSQNIIAELIAKKRTQLRKKSKRKNTSNSLSDPAHVDQILQSARRALRSDSGSSNKSASSSSSLFSLSSLLNRNAGESEPEEELVENDEEKFPTPSTSGGKRSQKSQDVLPSLRRKKMKLLSCDTESDEEENTNELSEEKKISTEEKKSDDVEIKFKKCRSSKIKNLRRKSSSSDNDD